MSLFTSYAFLATGASVARTVPDRIADVKNVKDFGAVGDGITNDHDAIIAAIDWQTSTATRGTIFFPPGTYYVSAPIDFGDLLVGFRGTPASIVVGNFADYVFRRIGSSFSTVFVEDLTIINNHATGGGIRFGYVVGAAIRNCNIVANQGINTTHDDSGSGGATSLEATIVNCQLSPGANTSGSIGIIAVADGPINNCRIVGYEKGIITWGQQGGHHVNGGYFEGNGIAIRTGLRPNGVDEHDGGSVIFGCLFKNNGTALHLIPNGGTTIVSGIRIDADETVTVYGSRPQYGIHLLAAGGNFSGIVVSGQYDQYAVSLDTATNQFDPLALFNGVNASNTSTHGGLAWLPPTTAQTASFQACNCPAPVYTVANLPAFERGINSASWSAGTTTLHIADNVGQYDIFQVTVTGVAPSGYNGTFGTVTVVDSGTISYPQSNPGSSTGGAGTATFNLNVNNGPAAKEGDCCNVSDADTATWAAPTLSGGSTHAKVRWNGSSWSVVGK